MFTLATSATQIDQSIQCLFNSTVQTGDNPMGAICPDLFVQNEAARDFVSTLDTLLRPLLHLMEGFPVRAIILSCAVSLYNLNCLVFSVNIFQSLWSICVVGYLFFAHRAAEGQWMNRRATRITLEIITLLIWAVSIVCATMLAIEYGSVVIVGGAEIKTAFTGVMDLITTALQEMFQAADKNISRSLSIVNEICTIGLLSIIAVVASGICGTVSFISLILACCISGKKKEKIVEKDVTEHLMPFRIEKPPINVAKRSSRASWFQKRSPLRYHPVGASPRI